MLKLHDRLKTDERGFTLIELLIVVIIIGILAAVAIPAFLSQRESAWNSAATSDVRNMATSQETLLTNTGSYAATVDDLEDEGFVASDEVTHNACEDDGVYAVSASHDNMDNIFYWFSTAPTILDSENGDDDAAVTAGIDAACDPEV